MSDPATAIVVPCGNHPDQRATHNCMNCGKPLCMTCVAARGYYCSDECKAAVQAAVPSAPRDPNLDRLDAQLDRGLTAVGSLFRKVIKPVVVVLVLVAGYGAYRLFFGPKGTVTATITITSSVGSFHAEPVGSDAALVRANEELYRLRLRTQTRDWSLNLPQDERWNVIGVRGDEVHLRSPTTLRRLDAQTGVTLSETPLPRRAGVLWRETVVSVQSAAAPKVAEDEESEPEITAGDPEMFSARRLLALAKGEAPAPPATEYSVRFDGATTAETKVAFTEFPRAFVKGDRLVVVGGRHLAVFDRIGAPRWQTQLNAEIVTFTHGAGRLAVATEQAVSLFDENTGELRWRQPNLAAKKLKIGPDGSVYAHIRLTADQAKEREKEYRPAKVALGGMTIPFASVPVLLKLDARDGNIRWGVRHIGEHVLFGGEKLFVADATEQLNLLAPSGLFQGYYSVRQLNPRTGADLWCYVAKGALVDAQLIGETPLIIAMTDPPTGRHKPVGTYLLQLIEAK